jgi:DNA polymerase
MPSSADTGIKWRYRRAVVQTVTHSGGVGVKSELLDLYGEVSSCRLACAGVSNDPDQGIIGRGYYCRTNPANVTLLLVSKNPATSRPDEERRYARCSEGERVAEHQRFTLDLFNGRERVGSRYHANILRWVATILGVRPTEEDVFSRTAMTALVKCHSLSDKTQSLPRQTSDCCFGRFLIREIEALRPAMLLALGKEPYDYLVRHEVRALHRLPVAYLQHPSWTNMKGGEQRYIADVLPQIREAYLQALDGISNGSSHASASRRIPSIPTPSAHAQSLGRTCGASLGSSACSRQMRPIQTSATTDPNTTLQLLDRLECLGFCNEAFRCLHHFGKAASITAHRRHCRGLAAKGGSFRKGSTNELVCRRLALVLSLCAEDMTHTPSQLSFATLSREARKAIP